MYYTVAIGHIAKVEDDLQLCAFFFFFSFCKYSRHSHEEAQAMVHKSMIFHLFFYT